MKINFNYNTKTKENFEKDISENLKSTLNFLNQPEEVEMDVSFVGNREMKTLNQRTRGKNVVTDVLSFPCLNLKAGEVLNIKDLSGADLINPETGNVMLGDIVICEAKAVCQAKENAVTLRKEIVKLCVHSLLHLLGFDHIKSEDYKVMNRVENEILGN